MTAYNRVVLIYTPPNDTSIAAVHIFNALRGGGSSEERDAEGNVYTYEPPAIIPDLEQLEIMLPDVGNVVLHAAVQMLIRVAHDQARKIEALQRRVDDLESKRPRVTITKIVKGDE